MSASHSRNTCNGPFAVSYTHLRAYTDAGRPDAAGRGVHRPGGRAGGRSIRPVSYTHLEELEWLVSAREIFFAAIAQLHTDGLTDIQRAARFYYVLKNSFGSNRKTFATSGNGIGCSIDYLEQVQLRLKGVKIENRDFEPILKTYDRPDALFYLDPPYLGTEKLYEGIFLSLIHILYL